MGTYHRVWVVDGDFVDLSGDQGTLLGVHVDRIEPGKSRTLTFFYGAVASEQQVLEAADDLDLQVYAYGQSQGAPQGAAVIFGFRD